MPSNPPPATWGAALLCALLTSSALAALPSAQTRARLAAGQPVWVIVEFDGSQADLAATRERERRHLGRDDEAIRLLRSQGYALRKREVERAAAGTDAAPIRDYLQMPMAAWRLSSLAALQRLQSQRGVRAVHEDKVLHVNSVSDLGFINQPQTAALGARGTGTTIAVIDGGLGGNYLASAGFSDFGTCSAVNTPASTCRVVYNQDFYTGTAASAETVHGTNVSAIALGVAPGAKLAMYNVFTGLGASYIDIFAAIDTIIRDQNLYNIVAVNMSLGDGGSYATQSQCGGASGSTFSAPIARLSAASIITVVAAGNSGSKAGLAEPACVAGVVSVGAVYDAAHGTITWPAAASPGPGGQCQDVSAADVVACFSQSASYLTMLAPGTLVDAPSAAFRETGTSQATPHVSGAMAVLRARYPAEDISQSIKRLTDTGVPDVDTGTTTRLVRPRLNLLAASNEGTAVTLSGSGPSQATAGGTGSYSLTVRNAGPLTATNVAIHQALPAGATFVSASAGCTYSGGVVTCSAGTLANAASTSFSITVRWTSSGPVYSNASLALDQIDSAAAAQQQLAFGTPPASTDSVSDAPLPPWSYVLLCVALLCSGAIAPRPRSA